MTTINRETPLSDLIETKALGLRSKRVLKELGVVYVADLRKITLKVVMAVEGIGKTTFDHLDLYRQDIADRMSTGGNGAAGGKPEEPKASRPKPAPVETPTHIDKSFFEEHYETTKGEALKAGMICFIEMIHEQDGDNDEVGYLIIEPFSVTSVEYPRSGFVMIHFENAGQPQAARVTHPINETLGLIAEGRKKAYACQR